MGAKIFQELGLTSVLEFPQFVRLKLSGFFNGTKNLTATHDVF